MHKLTVIPGGGGGRKPLAFNARGVAKYMLASPYAARKVVSDYAFPDEQKPKIILPAPAKDIIWNYFANGRNGNFIDDIIAQLTPVPYNESSFNAGRRRSALATSKHLRHFGPKLAFKEVHRRSLDPIMISGLPVRASFDFVCKIGDDRVIAVIVNAAASISDDTDKRKKYASIECEIGWHVTRSEMPSVSEIWYIDLPAEQIVRRHTQSHKGQWRDIETECDNIMMTYRTILARRTRGRLDAS